MIKACAGRRDGRWHLTWITPQIMRAYCDLHDAGYAHSFEVWNNDGELVGGGYGVAVGGAFTIESQFTLESHTSKIGFAVLNWHLAKWGFLLNDNKDRRATRSTWDSRWSRGPNSRRVSRRRCGCRTGAENGRSKPISRPSRNGSRRRPTNEARQPEPRHTAVAPVGA